MTGTLTVRYRRPTPLLAPLELAARHTGKEGRKVFAWGGIYHQGELTAEADGIFIEVPPDRMLDIVSGNAHSSRGAAGRPGLAAGDGARQRDQGRPARLRVGAGQLAALGSGRCGPAARERQAAAGTKLKRTLTPGIVDVQVHQDDGLPRPQGHPAPEHGQRHRRAHEGGQDVIGPVARRSVGVPVAVVAGEEALQRGQQVALGPRAGLHQGHAGGGVRHEDVDQPVAQPGAEALELGREVDDALPGGVDAELDRLHRAPSLP